MSMTKHTQTKYAMVEWKRYILNVQSPYKRGGGNVMGNTFCTFFRFGALPIIKDTNKMASVHSKPLKKILAIM